MRRVLFTLDSLDGGGCGVLMRDVWDNCDIRVYNDFGEANSSLIKDANLLLDDPDVELLVLAGLPLSGDVVAWLDENWPLTKLVALNNHNLRFSYKPVSWYKEDYFRSNSQSLFEEFINRGFSDTSNGRLSGFIDMIGLFASGVFDDPLYGISKDLNRLYNLLGMEQFVNRGYFQGFTPAERYALEMLQLREKRIFDSVEYSASVDVRGLRYRWVVVGESDIGDELGDWLLRKVLKEEESSDPYYSVVLNPSKGMVHLFSTGEVDVGNIASSLGGWGSRVRGTFTVPRIEIIGVMKKMLNKKEKEGDLK